MQDTGSLEMQGCSESEHSQNVPCCRDMLNYTKGAVTRNASEKKINSLLDFVSTSTDMKLLQVHAMLADKPAACTALQASCAGSLLVPY